MQLIKMVFGLWDMDWKTNEDELNSLLKEGWRVQNMIPMAGNAFGYASAFNGARRDAEGSHASYAALVLLEK